MRDTKVHHACCLMSPNKSGMHARHDSLLIEQNEVCVDAAVQFCGNTSVTSFVLTEDAGSLFLFRVASVNSSDRLSC